MSLATLPRADSFDAEVFRFESAWQSGAAPLIDDFVPSRQQPDAADSRADLLAELVLIDLEYRWRKGNLNGTGSGVIPVRPRIEDYLTRYPELDGLWHERCGEFLGHEYRVRRRWGDGPSIAEYAQRFPTLADSLPELLSAVDDELQEQLPASPLPLDRPFAHFQLLEVLGQGGMGTVYRARDEKLDRIVALKALRGGPLATPTALARFRDEAATVARLAHPQIVPVFEVGESDGTHYFTMQLVDGVDLSKRLDRFRGDIEAGVQLIAQVADAVHYAHQRGILHRDLKPENILLDAAGAPHITDFGLAKRLDDNAALTHTGDVVGTPSYMSPEQAAGQADAITTAADVYGLGAVLYAVLAGHPPFRAAAPRKIVAASFDPRDGELLAIVPRDALVRDSQQPEQDYAIELWRWQPGVQRRQLVGHRAPIEAHAFDPTGSWLASGDADGVTIVWRVADGKEQFRRREEYGPVKGIAFIDNGQRLLSAHAGGHLVLRDATSGQVTASNRLPERVTTLAMLPDQTRCVVGAEQGKLWLSRLPELELDAPHAESFGHTEGVPVSAVAVSRDGRWLASAAQREVILWDLDRGEQVCKLPATEAPVFQLAFDATAERLIVCCKEDVVTAWDLRPLWKEFAELGLK